MEVDPMNHELHGLFEARDAFGIVSSQVDDGRLTLMCESVFESAQFALMLIDQAQSAGRGPAESHLRVRGVDLSSGIVLLDSRVDGSTHPVDGLPVSSFIPTEGETLVPFLVRAVESLLEAYDSTVLQGAA
jgi:hypothetical protein